MIQQQRKLNQMAKAKPQTSGHHIDKAIDAKIDANEEKRQDLIERARANDGSVSLVPTKKVKGNHQVEAVLVDGEPVEDGDMTVVKVVKK